jgi:sigma54-dependent transcription regulator
MEHVKVGMFNLPGLKFEKEQIPPELDLEIQAWAQENNCGMQMNEWLWSFKNEAQRDWFILRWIDHIPKIENEQ